MSAIPPLSGGKPTSGEQAKNDAIDLSRPGVYRCKAKECRKDFTVTTKSVMESSHIKLHIWLQAF